MWYSEIFGCLETSWTFLSFIILSTHLSQEIAKVQSKLCNAMQQRYFG